MRVGLVKQLGEVKPSQYGAIPPQTGLSMVATSESIIQSTPSLKCFECGKMGHTKRNYVKLRTMKSKHLPQLGVKIIRPMGAVVDIQEPWFLD